MPWDVYSIRERNLMFCNAIEDILGLSRGKGWVDVRRELSDDQVKQIHAAYMSLWPKDTSIADLLPRPDGRIFRALYVGLIDPRTIAASVIGWLGYFDEILVLNPFANAANMRPEYSPIESPSQYKEQTIKNVALLLNLAPLIHAGIVHLVPDPIEFNETFRDGVWAIAKERRSKLKPDAYDFEVARALGSDDFKRAFARLPDGSLRRQIREYSPELTDYQITDVIAYIRREQAADPLALIQPMAADKGSGQLQVMRGVNFDLALFLAQLTGAVIYSEQRLTRADLEAARVPPEKGMTTTDRVLPLQISLAIDPEKADAARTEPFSQAFRASLRTLLAAALGHGESPNEPALDAALSNVKAVAAATVEPAAASALREKRLRDVVFDIDADLVVPQAGYSLTAVRRFLVAFGRRRHTNAVPFAIIFGHAASGAEARQQERRGV